MHGRGVQQRRDVLVLAALESQETRLVKIVLPPAQKNRLERDLTHIARRQLKITDRQVLQGTTPAHTGDVAAPAGTRKTPHNEGSDGPDRVPPQSVAHLAEGKRKARRLGIVTVAQEEAVESRAHPTRTLYRPKRLPFHELRPVQVRAKVRYAGHIGGALEPEETRTDGNEHRSPQIAGELRSTPDDIQILRRISEFETCQHGIVTRRPGIHVRQHRLEAGRKLVFARRDEFDLDPVPEIRAIDKELQSAPS